MKLPFGELARYVLVGGASTVADYGSYFFLTRYLAFPALFANPVAYLFGNVVSFFGHHFITFRSRAQPHTEYPQFLIVSVVGLGVSQGVLSAALALGAPDLVSKGAAVLISGLFNYLANRYWTFRKRR